MHLRARYDWNKTGEPRVALATRIGGAILAVSAALSWPLFLFLAVTHDWTVIFAPLLITAGAVVQRAGMRKVYGVPAEPEPVPEPEPRVPRDLDRPYPRPKGGRRKLDKTCPVCGTGDETGSLGGKVLGWPAHASCAEWLGENWRPARPAPPPFSPDKQLAGYIEQGQKLVAVQRGTTYTTYVGAGGTVATMGGAGGVSGDVMAWLANGLISADEARLRLNAEILSGFALPGPDVSDAFTRKACPDCGMEFSGTADAIDTSLYVHRKDGQCEQRRRNRDATEQRLKPPGAPVITEYCTCGFKFTGTAEWIKRELDAHHASGACPHSARGRQAGQLRLATGLLRAKAEASGDPSDEERLSALEVRLDEAVRKLADLKERPSGQSSSSPGVTGNGA